MTADQIVKLLAEKHARDVFVSECKDGSSWGGHLRMDAWAMARSWAHPCMYGYEVKISRADFLGDNKWPGYLPLCNRFSFVTTRGLIRPDELSEGVGLLEVASTGTCLRTIRKSAYREIEPPAELLKYILMCRAKIGRSPLGHIVDSENAAQFWARWLREKRDLRDVGHKVSRRLASLIAEKIDTVECENKRLTSENRNLARAREILKKLGVYPGHWDMEESIKKRVEELHAAIPPEVRSNLRIAWDSIGRILEAVGDNHEMAQTHPGGPRQLLQVASPSHGPGSTAAEETQ